MVPKKLKIALPISSFLPNKGGAEIGLHYISRELKKKATPIVIIPWTNYWKLKFKGINLGYKVLPLLPFSFRLFNLFPRISIFFTKQLFLFYQKKFKFDFWHCTIGYPLSIWFYEFNSLFYKKFKKKVPHLIRCVGEDIQIKRDIKYGVRLDKKKDNIIRNYLPKLDYFVSISKSIYKEYIKIGISAEKILKIPNGIGKFNLKLRPSKKSLRKKFNIPDNGFVYLSVGRNHIKKNYISLIKSFSLIKKDYENCFLVILGDKVKELNPLVKKLKLTENIILLSEETRDLQIPSSLLLDSYKMADVFVFPSKIESFGIVAIEAMSAGLPVISYNVEGIKHLIKRNYNGIILYKKDIYEFARGMKIFFNNKDLLKKIKKNSIKTSKVYYWENIVRIYLKNYYRIIEKTNS